MDSNKTARFYSGVFWLSLVTLPFLYYVSLCGLFTVLVFLLKTFKRTALDPLTQKSLLAISGLMVVSSLFAFNKGEAFLQLTNFLPFFLFFAVLPFAMSTAERLEKIASGLVLAAIPINIASLFEYILKSPLLPSPLQAIAWIERLRSNPHVGRAMVMFEHPNALASYLVLMLGLGLGLLLKYSAEVKQHNAEQHTERHQGRSPLLAWLYAGTFLNLIGIFCSGSRNGVIVAISQLILFSFFIRSRRSVLITGLLSLLSVVAGAALFGIGGRAVSVGSLANDPRVGVWQIALDLIQERPWLGWGLGNFKFLYEERLIDPNFPYIAHPHNIWLLFGAEGGIPLAIAMTLLVGYICYQAVRMLIFRKLSSSERAISLGYLFAFWGCVAFGFFDVTLYDARLNVINWVILAGIYAMGRSPTKEQTPLAS